MMVAQQDGAMADPKHLARLKKGVEPWNKWRQANPKLKPDLSRANLTQAKLSKVNLQGSDLTGAILNGANLAAANLSRARLFDADLRGARLGGADLQEAEFGMASLSGAVLKQASLKGATFFDADLRGANLIQADLTGCFLVETDLCGADLVGANVTGATMGYTIIGDSDLRTVKGLETVEHLGPSTIGIDTMFLSQGQIPEIFLDRAGVPHDLTTYVSSLNAQASEFSSCFISYSSRDDAFATELHMKLQGRHVRCWKDSEDLKIGDKFQDVIERAIRTHDKLLLVLSETSINSSWVEWEVKRALNKEQQQGSTVLFPVRLDDAVMETPYPWAAEVRKRHICDFRRWTDRDSFQKSLDRLLRDLKSQESTPKLS
jgi:hypothetical protein